MGTSSLQVGQEVNVRVLRIDRGRLTLTMKKEENMEELNMKLNQGVVHKATNPFLLAFRKNKEIASFLDEREKQKAVVEAVEIIDGIKTESDVLEAEDSGIPDVVPDKGETSSTEVINEKATTAVVADPTDEIVPPESVEAAIGTIQEDGGKSIADFVIDEASVSDENEEVSSAVEIKTESEEEKTSLNEVRVGEEDIKVAVGVDSSAENASPLIPEASIRTIKEEKVLIDKDEQFLPDPVINEAPVTNEVKETSNSIALSETSIPNEVKSDSVGYEEVVSPETVVPEDIVSNQAEEATIENNPEVVSKMPLTMEDEIAPVASKNVPSIPVENGGVISSGETNGAPQESATKATKSSALVKQLREETGAGMMDCKKALSETGGDIAKAQEFL
ncbi:hypothetical protein QJS10_CPA06g00719 [Acorus calamus]|uniref:Elongation factor Ts, mitochondrial n=1 Tax=Acorus calamus TaxID=4465 RepID=A0AAV9EM62_ACOCL|nr:hypothetical protein QJS10_CPA06g00719 [Acorus calamus]